MTTRGGGGTGPSHKSENQKRRSRGKSQSSSANGTELGGANKVSNWQRQKGHVRGSAHRGAISSPFKKTKRKRSSRGGIRKQTETARGPA